MGTRSFHHFYPVEVGVVAYKRTSDDELTAGTHCFYITPLSDSLTDLAIMSYIVCRYDGKWRIGMILELDREKNDVRVTFMHPHGPAKSFYRPNRDDICWMPPTSVLLKLSSPSTTNGRSYTTDNQALNNITELLT